jgi:hypothetical protein
MARLLLALSIIVLLLGFLFLSEATTGVGIIAAAGVLAIWSRIAQADTQHKAVMAELTKRPKE